MASVLTVECGSTQSRCSCAYCTCVAAYFFILTLSCPSTAVTRRFLRLTAEIHGFYPKTHIHNGSDSLALLYFRLSLSGISVGFSSVLLTGHIASFQATRLYPSTPSLSPLPSSCIYFKHTHFCILLFFLLQFSHAFTPVSPPSSTPMTPPPPIASFPSLPHDRPPHVVAGFS